MARKITLYSFDTISPIDMLHNRLWRDVPDTTRHNEKGLPVWKTTKNRLEEPRIYFRKRSNEDPADKGLMGLHSLLALPRDRIGTSIIRAAPDFAFGTSPEVSSNKRKRSTVLSLLREPPGGSDDYCHAFLDYGYSTVMWISPKPNKTLAQILYDWLLTPMPELSMSILNRGSCPDHISQRRVFKWSEIPSNQLGEFWVKLPEDIHKHLSGIDSSGVCRAFYRSVVFEENTPLWQWLTNPEKLYQVPFFDVARSTKDPLFNMSFRLALDFLIEFRYGEDSLVIALDRLPLHSSDDDQVEAAKYLLVDVLALLTTLAGKPKLPVNETVVLLFSWLSTWLRMSSLIPNRLLRKNSLFFLMHLLGELRRLGKESMDGKAIEDGFWHFLIPEEVHTIGYYHSVAVADLEMYLDYIDMVASAGIDRLWNALRLSALQVGYNLPETYHPEAFRREKLTGE